MKWLAGLTLALALTIAGCGSGSNDKKDPAVESHNPYPNVPSGSGGGTLNAAKNFSFLQSRFQSAVVSPTPWAGFWFPYASNGISNAASKYDAANAGSQGAANWEIGHHGTGLGDVADWWGHCNGWSAAAILTPEPRDSKTVGGETFDVSDRKALLTETFMEVTGDFLGTRVDDPSDRSSAAFNDITPAQFFLMITNVIGSQRRTFVMDRFTGHEVWNQPVVAYANAAIAPADYLGPDPSAPNVFRVNVTTQIFWADDNVNPDIVTPAFDPANPASVFKSRTLKYELWLDGPVEFDSAGNITSSGDVILTSKGVGGRWKNGNLPAQNSHPDYMWIPTGPAPSNGFKNPKISDAWVLSNIK